MGPRALLVIAGVAALGCGCKHPPRACAPSLESSFELRDRSGAIELTLRRPPATESTADPQSRDVCDGNDRLVARLVDRGALGIALDNAAGDPQVRIARADATADATIYLTDPATRAAKPSGPLRLHEQDGLLRLLDPIGVPVGQISVHDGQTIALDPAGSPIATAELVDNKLVVRARDGAVLHYVVGVASERAAAAFAFETLPPATRLALARWLDRK